MTVDEAQRQQAHVYLDLLPPEHLSAVRNLLETMLDPFSRTLANAPIEDEEISEEEERAVARSIEWFKYNEGIPFEEVLAEFGLTLDHLERMDHEALPGEIEGCSARSFPVSP
jgi:hypothetical protein